MMFCFIQTERYASFDFRLHRWTNYLASMHTTATTSEPAVAKVKKCTRLSFECHTALLLEDLLEEEDIDDEMEKRLNNLCLGNDGVLADLF